MSEDYLVTEIVDSLPKVTSIMKRLNAKKFGERVFFFELIDLGVLYHCQYSVWKDGKRMSVHDVVKFEKPRGFKRVVSTNYKNSTELFHLKVYRSRIKNV